MMPKDTDLLGDVCLFVYGRERESERLVTVIQPRRQLEVGSWICCAASTDLCCRDIMLAILYTIVLLWPLDYGSRTMKMKMKMKMKD